MTLILHRASASLGLHRASALGLWVGWTHLQLLIWAGSLLSSQGNNIVCCKYRLLCLTRVAHMSLELIGTLHCCFSDLAEQSHQASMSWYFPMTSTHMHDQLVMCIHNQINPVHRCSNSCQTRADDMVSTIKNDLIGVNESFRAPPRGVHSDMCEFRNFAG